jgi:hypothetical protein
MELECPAPCSKEDTIEPYPEPKQSGPYLPILSKTHLSIILQLLLGLPSCLIPSAFPLNILTAWRVLGL